MDGYLAFALHKNSLINITDFSFTWKIQCNLVLDYLLCIWTICSRMDQIWMIIILHWIMFCCAKLFIFTWTNEHRNCWGAFSASLTVTCARPLDFFFLLNFLTVTCEVENWDLSLATTDLLELDTCVARIFCRKEEWMHLNCKMLASYASQEEHDYFQVLTKHNFIISKLVQEFYITLYCTNIHS